MSLDVLIELAGLLCSPSACRSSARLRVDVRVSVVLAQDPAAGQGVLEQLAGLLVLTQRVRGEAEVVG